MSDLEHAFSRLDRFLEDRIRARHVAGLAVALTSRDKLLRISTAGFADLAGQVPVTPNTLFEIGSIGKSFTAIALLQQMEAGQVELSEPISRYLPWFRVESPVEPIAIHHLLSHTSGLARGTEFTGEARYTAWSLRGTETGCAPGTCFHYSNDGYKLLGVLLEDLTGRFYGDVIQSRLLDPLGMSGTEPVITHEARKRLAVGHRRFFDDRPPHRSQHLVPATWLETGTGDGSIASTPADMASYLRMLMNRGYGPHGRLISEATFNLMKQPVIAAPKDVFCDYELATGERMHPTIDAPEQVFYGYGLVTSRVNGHAHVGHEGAMVGYVSSILADLDDGLGVVVLVNAPEAPSEIARFALKLMRAAMHGKELPLSPELPDPTDIEDAAAYAGCYQARDKEFELTTKGRRLILLEGTDRVPLEPRGSDRFYVDHPNWASFLLRFAREKGQVVEAFHGPCWYTHHRYRGPATFDYPVEWEAYPGHYRSYNPWLSNFRIVMRKGALALITPQGEESTLAPVRGDLFRVGEEPHLPERIFFEPVVDGRALRAVLSGSDYYRTFTL